MTIHVAVDWDIKPQPTKQNKNSASKKGKTLTCPLHFLNVPYNQILGNIQGDLELLIILPTS